MPSEPSRLVPNVINSGYRKKAPMKATLGSSKIAVSGQVRLLDVSPLTAMHAHRVILVQRVTRSSERIDYFANKSAPFSLIQLKRSLLTKGFLMGAISSHVGISSNAPLGILSQAEMAGY